MNSRMQEDEFLNQMKPKKAPTPWQLLGFLFLYSILGYILGNFAAVIPLVIAKIPPSEWISAMKNPNYAVITSWVQILSSVCLFGIPTFLFALKNLQMPKQFYKLNKQADILTWTFIILLAVAAIPLVDLLSLLNEHVPLSASLHRYFQSWEDTYNKQILAILKLDTAADLIFSIIIIALLPAILEELFFRGALQTAITNIIPKKPIIAIVITAILFSAFHFSFFGFLPRAFLGFLLGYIYCRGQNMKLNIAIHFINNALTVVMMYWLYQHHQLNEQTLNAHVGLPLQIVSVLAFAIIFYLLDKNFKKNELNQDGVL